MKPVDPTVAYPRRCELAAELRGLRDLAGVSGRVLAQRIGVSQSKVSRIENGSTVPSLPEVEAWSRELGLPDDIQRRLTSMTKAAHTEAHPWRTELAGKGHLQNDVLHQECQAHKVRVFQTSVVPGLLQTPDYARHVFRLLRVPMSEADHAAAVAARMDRQIEMYEDNRTYEFLITEAALRWRPDTGKMLAVQLDRIAHLSTLGNVTVGVIPLRARATTVLTHGFALYTRDDLHEATVETVHARVEVRGREEVEAYDNRWALLTQMALFDSEAGDFLGELAAEYRAMD
ncbi:helix-turn-helix domain-containing protein [Nocardia bovistercoris]|uniref:Helix-turn-helix domain-containing protein n=1 Tax=Nocardia bovistercoris TaxID=2785916 RepID=A0A931N701_9NOCA|nr:helix-turn-helix transcriptional regulator [Nocardia bovistercoris]MBH0781267.1 helix-turn-helix domain-containing protein [Nocardia bovistercoris]